MYKLYHKSRFRGKYNIEKSYYNNILIYIYTHTYTHIRRYKLFRTTENTKETIIFFY